VSAASLPQFPVKGKPINEIKMKAKIYHKSKIIVIQMENNFKCLIFVSVFEDEY
jgi:hypothetical protein